MIMTGTYKNDIFTIEVEYVKYEGYTVTFKETNTVQKFSSDITLNMFLEKKGYKKVEEV